MSREKNPIPSYSLHKSTGRARVRVAGRDFYLGKFGSLELLAQIIADRA